MISEVMKYSWTPAESKRVQRLLRSMGRELDRRAELFASASTATLTDYRDAVDPTMSRIVLLIVSSSLCCSSSSAVAARRVELRAMRKRPLSGLLLELRRACIYSYR